MEYGLLGEKLSHSFSKDIHNLIGDYKYELKEIAKEDVDAFMKAHDFKAINVTIPYKQTVIPYLDEIDEAAKLIGAVNTVVNKDGKLYGYNTDFYGMKSLMEKMGISAGGKNVLILGTGGTSKTATALVKSLGAASVCKVSRHPEGDEDDCPVISYEETVKKTETNIIINTTPCGMFPKVEGQPISLESFGALEGVVDAIYNPNCTNLVLDAKARGVKAEGGLYMLVGQAIKAAEFFFGKPVEKSKADEIFNIILGRKQNIVLVGMPACGKTTVGKQIARLLNRELIDSDAEIVAREGVISDIFAEKGEQYFRDLESKVIAELSQKNGCVISTGGGAVLRSENVHNLKMNGKIYFIDRPLEQLLPTADRPTANSAEKIKALYDVRYPIYTAAADMVVTGGVGPEKIARKIIKDAGVESDIDDDTATFWPSTAIGKISSPPSKSLAHRSLICAALSEGTSVVTNIDYSQDILATLDCIKTLGADYKIDGDKVTVTGGHLKLNDGAQFDCRESGSTLRFFIPMAMAFGTAGTKATFKGSEVLMTRPQSVYEEMCAEKGISFERANGKISVGSGLTSGIYKLAGNISSQFITGLLFVLPLMQGDSEIQLIPPVESRPYIDLTLQAMHDFGVKVEWKDENTLTVPGGQTYKAREIAVEGDYSNAAFLDVFNTLNGKVEVGGLYDNSLQGDRVYKQMFTELVKGCPTLDISDCPDLGPILFVTAALHNGGVFNGTKRLAIKESDRGKIMCEELAKFGVASTQSENQIVIKSGVVHTPAEIVHGHNDHRIVMSLSTMLSVTGGTVDDAHAVRKSYPGYFNDMKKLGIKVKR